MKRSYDQAAPFVGEGSLIATVEIEPSDIEAMVALQGLLEARSNGWRNPKAVALKAIIDEIQPGKSYRLRVLSIPNQACGGRAVAEALELAGDLDSFNVIHEQVPHLGGVERRHKAKLYETERV